jgi:hypothetical protein
VNFVLDTNAVSEMFDLRAAVGLRCRAAHFLPFPFAPR